MNSSSLTVFTTVPGKMIATNLLFVILEEFATLNCDTLSKKILSLLERDSSQAGYLGRNKTGTPNGVRDRNKTKKQDALTRMD